MSQKRRVLSFTALSFLILLVGCSGGSQPTPDQEKTLKNSLNTPVDVEKIRKEYAEQQKQGKTGAAGEGM
jgi:hypothetical protein